MVMEVRWKGEHFDMADDVNRASETTSETALVVDTETSRKKRAFLDALVGKFSVYHASKASGVGRSTVYKWREADPEFAQAWDDCQEDAVDALEQSLYERAKEKDTIAAIFLLKGARPEKYKDRVASELTGKNGGPIEHNAIVPQEEVNRRLAEMGMLPKPHVIEGEQESAH